MALSEFELIARLRELFEQASDGTSAGEGAEPPAARVVVGSGDDAAVTVPGAATITSVDSMVEGVHFRRGMAPLRSVGRKALGTALSDLAAMGASPGEAYVQLALPEDLGAEGCLELGQGVAAAAAEHGVRVLGGDVTRAPVLWVATTAVGHAPSPDVLVRRSGAEPGDVLAVTGELGGAAAGLLLLDRPRLADALQAEVAEALRRRQLEPTPRLAAGRALATAGAKAMIDVSDGLGRDAGHLAEASGVGLAIELGRLPLQQGVEEVARAAGIDSHDLATARGEDYELLVALPPDRLRQATAAVAAAGTRLTSIGRVEDGAGVVLRAADGSVREASGFDHLRA
jgi:thiamine-monophosphate kinase